MNSTTVVDSCKFGLLSSVWEFCVEKVSGPKSYIQGPRVVRDSTENEDKELLTVNCRKNQQKCKKHKSTQYSWLAV